MLSAIKAPLNKYLPMHMREGRTGNRVSNHPSQKSIAKSILWPKSVVAERERAKSQKQPKAPEMRFMSESFYRCE